MFCASYVYLFNLRWTGFTSPQPIVGRVYPSTLGFYPSKGRVDGSLDEAVLLAISVACAGNYDASMVSLGFVAVERSFDYNNNKSSYITSWLRVTLFISAVTKQTENSKNAIYIIRNQNTYICL